MSDQQSWFAIAGFVIVAVLVIVLKIRSDRSEQWLMRRANIESTLNTACNKDAFGSSQTEIETAARTIKDIMYSGNDTDQNILASLYRHNDINRAVEVAFNAANRAAMKAEIAACLIELNALTDDLNTRDVEAYARARTRQVDLCERILDGTRNLDRISQNVVLQEWPLFQRFDDGETWVKTAHRDLIWTLFEAADTAHSLEDVADYLRVIVELTMRREGLMTESYFEHYHRLRGLLADTSVDDLYGYGLPGDYAIQMIVHAGVDELDAENAKPDLGKIYVAILYLKANPLLFASFETTDWLSRLEEARLRLIADWMASHRSTTTTAPEE